MQIAVRLLSVNFNLLAMFLGEGFLEQSVNGVYPLSSFDNKLQVLWLLFVSFKISSSWCSSTDFK